MGIWERNGYDGKSLCASYRSGSKLKRLRVALQHLKLFSDRCLQGACALFE